MNSTPGLLLKRKLIATKLTGDDSMDEYKPITRGWGDTRQT